MHSPPSDRATQGGIIDPNVRMGLIAEDRNLVGTTSETYTPSR
jgi:hypothetical protein